MTKDRVCAIGSALPRRTFCAAIPALAFVDVRPEQDTQVLRLFREWAELTRLGWNASEDMLDQLADRQIEIEAEMCATPSETLADLAAKFTALMDWGMSELPEDSPLWDEVRNLVPVWKPGAQTHI